MSAINFKEIAERFGGSVIEFRPAPKLPGKQVGKLRLWSTQDIMAEPIGTPYFLKGLITEGELGIWYGPSNCGKSFLMLHIAYHIAMGLPSKDDRLFGRRVRQAPVLYCALEAGRGINLRGRALIEQQGHCDDFKVIPMAINFLDPSMAQNVIDAANDFGAKVVIVDTCARAMPGADENDAGDMGLLINALETIRSGIKGAVVGVHHTGKDASRGMRGSYALFAGIDVAVEISGDSGVRSITFPKIREGAKSGKLGFELEEVQMGEDDDGDPSTTCLVREVPATSGGPRPKGLSPGQRLAVDDVQAFFADASTTKERTPPEPGMSPQDCVDKSRLRDHLAKRGHFEVSDGKFVNDSDRKAFDRLLKQLRMINVIQISGSKIWLLRTIFDG